MSDPKKKLLAFFDADPERLNFIESILPIYVEELNKAILKLKETYANNAKKEFAAITHKIKGSALTFGAKPIYTECLGYEAKLPAIHDINEIDLTALLQAVNELNEFGLED